MTLAEIPRRTAVDDSLDNLLAKIDEVVASTLPTLTLAAARKACNEAGVPSYQRQIDEALDQRKATGKRLIEAEARRDAARTVLDDLVGEIEWELSGRFETRANKQWLAVDDDGQPIPEAEQRSMAEAERKAWLGRMVRQNAEVVHAQAVLDAADAEVRDLRFDLDQIDKALTARKHQLDAAAAELATYRVALAASTKENR